MGRHSQCTVAVDGALVHRVAGGWGVCFGFALQARFAGRRSRHEGWFPRLRWHFGGWGGRVQWGCALRRRAGVSQKAVSSEPGNETD
eukprot:811449-Prymnesium_polylepis.1